MKFPPLSVRPRGRRVLRGGPWGRMAGLRVCGRGGCVLPVPGRGALPSRLQRGLPDVPAAAPVPRVPPSRRRDSSRQLRPRRRASLHHSRRPRRQVEPGRRHQRAAAPRLHRVPRRASHAGRAPRPPSHVLGGRAPAAGRAPALHQRGAPGVGGGAPAVLPRRHGRVGGHRGDVVGLHVAQPGMINLSSMQIFVAENTFAAWQIGNI